MKKVASFFKERFNIVENSILGIVLLGLEKLMDLEFTCPPDTGLAIAYSLVFLVVPTIIVGVVACDFSPGGIYSKDGKRENSAEIKGDTEEDDSKINNESNKPFQNLEMSEVKTETKNAKCRGCCANMQSHFFVIKAVVAWASIVFTDGRYGDCFVKSMFIENSNYTLLSWTEIRNNYLTHLFQMIGLTGILLVIIMVACKSRICSCLSSCGCKCQSESNVKCQSESESERYRRKNEDNLLQITEDILQERAKQRQKEFVVTLLHKEDWKSYHPGSPNALEELAKITGKWKEEIKKHLESKKLCQTEAKEALLPPNHKRSEKEITHISEPKRAPNVGLKSLLVIESHTLPV